MHHKLGLFRVFTLKQQQCSERWMPTMWSGCAVSAVSVDSGKDCSCAKRTFKVVMRSSFWLFSHRNPSQGTERKRISRTGLSKYNDSDYTNCQNQCSCQPFKLCTRCMNHFGPKITDFSVTLLNQTKTPWMYKYLISLSRCLFIIIINFSLSSTIHLITCFCTATKQTCKHEGGWMNHLPKCEHEGKIWAQVTFNFLQC